MNLYVFAMHCSTDKTVQGCNVEHYGAFRKGFNSTYSEMCNLKLPNETDWQSSEDFHLVYFHENGSF